MFFNKGDAAFIFMKGRRSIDAALDSVRMQWRRGPWRQLVPPLSRWLRKIIFSQRSRHLLYALEKSQLQISFNWIEDYNGYNPITKERESFDWSSSLFKAGFFTWRWKMNLVFRWPAERQVSLVDPLFGFTGGVAQLLLVMESQRDLKNLNSIS